MEEERNSFCSVTHSLWIFLVPAFLWLTSAAHSLHNSCIFFSHQLWNWMSQSKHVVQCQVGIGGSSDLNDFFYLPRLFIICYSLRMFLCKMTDQSPWAQQFVCLTEVKQICLTHLPLYRFFDPLWPLCIFLPLTYWVLFSHCASKNTFCVQTPVLFIENSFFPKVHVLYIRHCSSCSVSLWLE